MAKPKRKRQTLLSFYKKIEGTVGDLHVQGLDDLADQDQNPQSDGNTVLEVEDEAPSRQRSPKVQRLNSDASVLVVELDPDLRCRFNYR
ncbi:hypothetical protein C2845_PM13G17790 [Panicum miliaceum]|uniref:Uncharacterized protein n=1 Tax=Panicum miliaceum TaxID=4540 RepID=A0A3L6RJL3_PANMI|nr:hypothetical protein C2845_PM13G17790 [Panicum miliaceum]